jgi:hypothetical protein
LGITLSWFFLMRSIAILANFEVRSCYWEMLIRISPFPAVFFSWFCYFIGGYLCYIRILFSQQPVRYLGVINESWDKRKSAWERLLKDVQNGRLEGGGGRAPQGAVGNDNSSILDTSVKAEKIPRVLNRTSPIA